MPRGRDAPGRSSAVVGFDPFALLLNALRRRFDQLDDVDLELSDSDEKDEKDDEEATNDNDNNDDDEHDAAANGAELPRLQAPQQAALSVRAQHYTVTRSTRNNDSCLIGH